MQSHFKTLAIAAGIAMAASTAAFAQTGSGEADNSNAIIGGARNQTVVGEHGTPYGYPTGAGHADNTNSLLANPDDFQRQPAPGPYDERDLRGNRSARFGQSFNTPPERHGYNPQRAPQNGNQ
jgi:hypothetical protein